MITLHIFLKERVHFTLPFCLVRRVEYFHHVHNPHVGFGVAQPLLQLRHAAGVSGGDHFGFGCEGVSDLAPLQPLRHIPLDQRVETS